MLEVFLREILRTMRQMGRNHFLNHILTMRAFTLVELVVTLVVLSVLGAVAIPVYRSYVLRSRSLEAPILISELVSLELAYWNKPHVDKATGNARFPCFQTSGAADDATGVAEYHPSRNAADLHAGPHPWNHPTNTIPPAFNILGFRPSGLISYTYKLAFGPNVGFGAFPYCAGDENGAAGLASGLNELTVRAIGDLDEDNLYSRQWRVIRLAADGTSPRADALVVSSAHDDF